MFIKAVNESDGGGASWLTMSLIRADERGMMSVRRQISARYVQQDCLCSSLAACALPNGSPEETPANKERVREFIDAVTNSDGLDRLDDFIDRSVFVSHTPGGCIDPDRLDDYASRRSPRSGLRYHGVDDLVGEGSFVAVFSAYDLDGQHARTCDLFRLAEGKIVEHWDVVEPVAAHTVAHNDEA
ncbi:nuclear transport factor 2 family protein [Maricaulis parjimensis]|uniref:nuclear transport factor 2 family protein n=1 Tax=Maricaulis parjimensis TaxID=144023 RepID=UPI00193A66D5|nr:nuclear transport factor 2 family protein [Maricaulis parjimensis]